MEWINKERECNNFQVEKKNVLCPELSVVNVMSAFRSLPSIASSPHRGVKAPWCHCDVIPLLHYCRGKIRQHKQVVVVLFEYSDGKQKNKKLICWHTALLSGSHKMWFRQVAAASSHYNGTQLINECTTVTGNLISVKTHWLFSWTLYYFTFPLSLS